METNVVTDFIDSQQQYSRGGLEVRGRAEILKVEFYVMRQATAISIFTLFLVVTELFYAWFFRAHCI